MAVDAGPHSTRLAVADLGQNVLAHRHMRLDLRLGPEHALDEITKALFALLADACLPATAVKTIVMGLPGPVDSRTGRPVRPPIMPGWDGFPVGDIISERFSCMSLVDNDVNLMALGEARALPADQAPLLLIKIGTGIGGGLISASGELHRGADGAACDLGHIRVPGADNVVCRCGNVGCVEAIASAEAVLQRLRADHPQLTDIEGLARMLRESHPTAVRQVRAAAAVLGEVVATLVHVYNPRRIALSGLICAASDDVLAGVRGVVYRQALPLATRHLTLAQSLLGGHAGLAGGVVAGIEMVLAPPGIPKLLGTVTAM
ncbi:ROK family protein [Streptomyces sp. NPDC019396]|uniref:ROK family protein n=1 Tax=Streptomyces sp. NPDC019396 TaxID=3154687 RepID=UPI0033D08D55